MGKVVPYRPPGARDDNTARIGMVLFLASWAMMFASLFFAYAFVRTRAEAWPPPGMPPLPWALPLLSTAILGTSSAVLQAGLGAMKRGQAERLGLALGVTVVLGTLFLSVQFQVWQSLVEAGMRPDNGGAYGSVFYGLTLLHGLHVVVGLVGLMAMAFKVQRGIYNPARHVPVQLWGWYWHLVGVLWLCIFISVFLL